jgi:hypothetical protein
MVKKRGELAFGRLRKWMECGSSLKEKSSKMERENIKTTATMFG